MYLINKRICVTGGAGFLGSHIVDKLLEQGCANVTIPTHEMYDLRRRENVLEMYDSFRPDIVIHAAVAGGGIGWNRKNPATALYDNLMMGMNLLEEGRDHDLEKFIQIGSVCAYPLNVSTPALEEELWSGLPEPTNGPYGLSKRILSTACEAYRNQYEFNAISLMPVNLYGPRDDFNPESSHVIAAMIKKFSDAVEIGQKSVTLWGTGDVTREFLYVEDCAEAVVLATKYYDNSDPINIGSGKETRIDHLAQIVAKQCGFWGDITWDSSKPNGQPRRLFDSSKAKREMGFQASTDLVDGIYDTVDWYNRNLGWRTKCEK